MENNLYILAVLFIPFTAGVINLSIPRQGVRRWLGLIASALSWWFALLLLLDNVNHGTQLYRMGGFEPPYGIVFVVDRLSALFGLMAASVFLAAFIYTLSCRDKSIRLNHFVTLFLNMQTALIGAFYTGDLFTMFVFIELLVLSSVVLTATSDNKLGREAAMKYVFISGMGSLFLLLGIGSIYVTFGSLNMAHVAWQLALTDTPPLLASASLVMLSSAFLLKGAVFPFHFWQPDFHTTAPTPVSAVLSAVVVKLGVYGILRLVTLLFVNEAQLIRWPLLFLAIISIYFGGFSALGTHNGKRMLAYSTFAQIGFILLGVGWGTHLALVAALVYAVNHAFIKSALLMLFGVVASRTKDKTAALDDVVGVGKTLPPYVGLLYLLGGMALAGLPPMNGFVSKMALVRSGLEAQSWWFVGLAVGGGLLTLLYMMRSWQSVFQQKPNENTVKLKEEGVFDNPLAPALLITTALVLGIYAQPLFDYAHLTVEQMQDNTQYIEAVGLHTDIQLDIEALEEAE